MSLANIKDRISPSIPYGKVGALLAQLPPDESSALLDVLRDPAYTSMSIWGLLQAERADGTRDNGVPAHLYDVSERTVDRWRKNDSRPNVTGL